MSIISTATYNLSNFTSTTRQTSSTRSALTNVNIRDYHMTRKEFNQPVFRLLHVYHDHPAYRYLPKDTNNSSILRDKTVSESIHLVTGKAKVTTFTWRSRYSLNVNILQL